MRLPALRDGWYAKQADPSQLASAGIYEWRIEGVGLYVGQSRRLASRLREYPNNVRKLIAKAPYRKGKPDGFRAIHKSLMDAHERKIAVAFSVLEICERGDLNAQERHWIKRRRQEEADGGLRVLNSI